MQANNNHDITKGKTMKSAHYSRGRSPARLALVVITATALSAGTLVFAQQASAAVPAFPNNIVVFPDRDFVSVEGYQDHAGETALVEVTRPGSGAVGSARSVVSGTDVAFEINHPGGVCWGADTAAKVTPDIRAGDTVSITFADGTRDETTTQDAAVTQDMTLEGSTLTVLGRTGPNVNRAQMEQRVINPDLGATDVGRRDIRALPGPLVPAAKGGYSSSLTFATDGTFLATYQFNDPVTAQIAAAADLGERAMAWQQEDADGNRQGLTIAEFGELGGPGMGGCPAGPGDQPAPSPGAASVVRSVDKTSMQVKWTAAASQPGAAAVTGYSVVAIDQTVTNGQQVQLGARTNASTAQSTITNLNPASTYTVEVRSLAGSRMSDAYTVSPAAAPQPGDTTVPTLALTPAPEPGAVTKTNSVTVTGDGQNFFTTDGSPVISGGLPSDTSQLYTGPVPITGPTTLKVAAFDQAGNFQLIEGEYAPLAGSTLPPAAPTGLAATAGQGSATLRWDASDPSVTGYQVTVYGTNGTALPLSAQPPETTARTQTITGLAGGSTYGFSVKAKTAAAGFGAESQKVTTTVQPVTDRLTITSARWKSGEFRVVGTASMVGATVTVHRVTSTGAIGAAIPGALATVTAAAPPGIGDFSIRLRNGAAPTQNPGRIYVKSSNGGVAGPFTVANG